jgi:tetratricopeptide (TPR) repeat protein
MRRTAVRAVLLAGALFLCACAAPENHVAADITPKIGVADNAALYLSVIDQLVKSDDAYAALANLDQYDRQFGPDNPSRKLRADALLKIGKANEAGALYNQLVTTALDAEAWNGLGRIAAQRENWQKAVDCFQKASKEDPTRADFQSNLGYALIQTHAYSDAELALRKARQLAPDDRRIANNVALLVAMSGQQGRLAEFFPQGGKSVGLTPAALEGLVATYRARAGS